jgi:hypothetical protein
LPLKGFFHQGGAAYVCGDLVKGSRDIRARRPRLEGVRLRDIAEAIGRGLNVPIVSITPEEPPAHFGWMSMFAAHSIPASSAITREKLGWNPTGPGLISDLENMNYERKD